MSYSFNVDNVGKLSIIQLSRDYCINNEKKIIDLINIIPYINWSIEELLSQKEDYYGNKWNYSYAVVDEDEEIIGIIISYFRISDNRHIFDSLYIHRVAVLPNFQNRGIGTHALQYFINKSFKEIPWLLNITLQTNDEKRNEKVINFYKNLGFRRMYNLTYPDKIDILMMLERKYYREDRNFKIKIEKINLSHPRIPKTIINSEMNILPIFYFSSTNERKKKIVEFIFHNYNIDILFTSPPVEMVEPQVESPDLEEEKKLVSIPLKNVSRFIINTTPYIIEDTMLFIEFFNRFESAWELPGLDTKRWLRQLGLDGILDIIKGSDMRKARFVSQTGAYIKSGHYCFGRGETKGRISNYIAVIDNVKYGTYPYFFNLIFIPEGASKTLAEMDMYEFAKYDYMRKSIRQLIINIEKHIDALEYKQYQYTIFDFL